MLDEQKKFHIFLLGNIGSGKSTIVKNLQKHTDMAVEDEPMDHWENINGKNLLKIFYDDKERWSFAFQTKVLLTLR